MKPKWIHCGDLDEPTSMRTVGDYAWTCWEVLSCSSLLLFSSSASSYSLGFQGRFLSFVLAVLKILVLVRSVGCCMVRCLVSSLLKTNACYQLLSDWLATTCHKPLVISCLELVGELVSAGWFLAAGCGWSLGCSLRLRSKARGRAIHEAQRQLQRQTSDLGDLGRGRWIASAESGWWYFTSPSHVRQSTNQP